MNRHKTTPITAVLLIFGCQDWVNILSSNHQDQADNDRTSYQIQVEVTAYCPCPQCCGQYADGITASGHRIRPGDRFVAGPPGLSFGTLVDVPGYGLVPVLDRGGSIRGDRLDVFFLDHGEALEWGRRVLVVWVWNERE